MKIEFSFDDGKREDLRTAALLEQHGFTATFYIPTHTKELTDQEVKKLSEKHDIGGHTVTHPQDLKLLSDSDLGAELMVCKSVLEDIIGRPVTKFCYPRGRFDARVKQAVKDAGFTSARTTRVGTTREFQDTFEQNTTVHVYPRKEYKGKSVYDYFEDHLGDQYMHIWGHSNEIDRLGLWDELEMILARLAAE